MAKKIEEAEVKKECPSCGLGVALDSKICEFCGWDFEEEDEWILQIEKLERELLLEKQKFEPGSVEQRIEATLYTPTSGRPEHARGAKEEPASPVKAPPVESAAPAATQGPVRKVRAMKAAPPPPTRPAQAETGPEDAKSKKVRVVRKVKT